MPLKSEAGLIYNYNRNFSFIDSATRSIHIAKLICENSKAKNYDYTKYLIYNTNHHIVSCKTVTLHKSQYNTLSNCLKESYLDIDLNRILELYEDIPCDIVILLGMVENEKYVNIIPSLINIHLKRMFEKNNCELLDLKYNDTLQNTQTTLHYSSKILDYVIKYTNCKNICKIFDHIEKTSHKFMINTIKNSQHRCQKEVLLYELFCMMTYNSSKLSFCDKIYELDKNKKQINVQRCVEIIKDGYSRSNEVFEYIFSKITPSVEYMNMFISYDTPYDIVGLYLMLDKGVIPNEETLELACTYMKWNEICIIMDQKVLLTQECFELYIGYNPYIASSKQNYIDIFVENGLCVTDAIVKSCIMRNITIDFEKHDIKYTLEMYKLCTDTYRGVDHNTIQKFKKVPAIKNIIIFAENIRTGKWPAVAKIGLRHKIIPGQLCFDIACESYDENIPIKFLQAANMTNTTNMHHITNYVQHDPTESIEYMEFLSDKNVSFTITEKNLRGLCRKSWARCMQYLVYAAYDKTSNDSDDSDDSDKGDKNNTN